VREISNKIYLSTANLHKIGSLRFIEALILFKIVVKKSSGLYQIIHELVLQIALERVLFND
jgi:hypothetical protein